MDKISEGLLDFSEDGLVCLWEGEPFNGIAFETDASGAVVSEVSYENGIQQGPSREYFLSGEVKSEEEYENGSKHGVSREWFDNRCLRSEEIFEYSILIRKKEWSREGELLEDFEISECDPLFDTLKLLRAGARSDA